MVSYFRLLVQLEETERTFDDFWQNHSAKLRQCLELRMFEQNFKELQVNHILAKPHLIITVLNYI